MVWCVRVYLCYADDVTTTTLPTPPGTLSHQLWAFGWSKVNHEIGGCDLDPTPECHWTWGATENWVTEYVNHQKKTFLFQNGSINRVLGFVLFLHLGINPFEPPFYSFMIDF